MSGARILVVEDNETNMRLFRDVLEARGYLVLEAALGVSAIAIADDEIGRASCRERV